VVIEQGRRGNAGREGRSVLKVVETGGSGQVSAGSLLDEIAGEGARRMLAAALRAEAGAYVDALVEQVDEDGHRLVVRNGRHDPRTVTMAVGAVGVRAPRVNDKRVDEVSGERKRFASVMLPTWWRPQPEDQRGAAAALPPRPVRWRLRARVGAVPRHERGAFGLDDHPAL
jgi:hypothetical protein